MLEEKRVPLVRNYFRCPQCGEKIFIVDITDEILEMQCRDKECAHLFIKRRKA